jgi:hypothetical protein
LIQNTTVNILSPGFTSPNGAAFLHPLLVHRHPLEDVGITINITSDKDRAEQDCDVLGIDSKMFRYEWEHNRDSILEFLKRAQNKVSSVMWFDTTDSTGTLQQAVLPFVDLYCKSQLLVDRSQYGRSFYGGRIFTDFYHSHDHIEDEEPVFEEPLDVSKYGQKLSVSWNSCLSTYSLLGPWLIGAYRRLPLSLFLRYPRTWTSPESIRPNDLSARFGTTHGRRTVRYQREQIRKILGQRMDTEKLGRRAYMRETRNSKLVMSPFGWGEITLKDFEVFLTGGLLVKPSMEHLETWPDLYQAGETYVAHRWDLDDLEQQIQDRITDDQDRVRMAHTGQERYREYLIGQDAGERFATHLQRLIAQAL